MTAPLAMRPDAASTVAAELAAVTQVRVARPTAALAPLTAFYRDDVGLPLVARFEDHDGFDGAIFRVAPEGAQWELTQGPAHLLEPGPRGGWSLGSRIGDAALADPDGYACGRPGASARDTVFSRRTRALAACVDFYARTLGLAARALDARRAEFELPAAQGWLRIEQVDAAPPPPTVEDVLVFYFADRRARDAGAARLQAAGAASTRPHNPWWHERAACFADPDGYGVLLAEAG